MKRQVLLSYVDRPIKEGWMYMSKIFILNFSGRSNGNCSSISKFILDHLDLNSQITIREFSKSSINENIIESRGAQQMVLDFFGRPIKN